MGCETCSVSVHVPYVDPCVTGSIRAINMLIKWVPRNTALHLDSPSICSVIAAASAECLMV